MRSVPRDLRDGWNNDSVPAASFVAKSGAGNTSLLVRIMEELSWRGYSVGVVRYEAHRFEIDCEGKDTWRLTWAGVSPMVISSPQKLALVQTALKREMPLGNIISQFMEGSISC